MTWIRPTPWSLVAVALIGLALLGPFLNAARVAQAAGAPVRFVQAGPAAQQGDIVSCTGASNIIQGCVFTNGVPSPAWHALEQQAVADLLSKYHLPASDKSRLLGWERDAVRAEIFDKLRAIIQKAPAQRTADERQIYDQLAAFVRSKRLAAATFSKAEFNSWNANPCGYEAPPNFSYSIPTACAGGLGAALAPPAPPSLEEFQNYGTAHVMSQFQTDPALQAVAAGTSKAIGLITGVSLASGVVVGGIVGVGTFYATIEAIELAVAAETIADSALETASTVAAVAGATAFVAVAAIVIVAVTIGVIQGINVFTAAEIPGKLDAAVAAAQVTPDLAQMISSDAGKSELFSYFLLSTMPDYRATSGVPAARAGDPRFELDPGPSAKASATLQHKGWDGSVRTTYFSDGWFVDSAAGVPRLTLDIEYLDWDGKAWTAWRTGDTFLHTRPGGGKNARFVSDTIKYKDATGANRTAKIAGLARTPPSVNPTYSPPANAAGWNNTPVTVTWNWRDNSGAGLDPSTCPATSTISAGQIVAVTCSDLAGNRTSTSTNVKVDTKAPFFTGPPALSPKPNAAGWNNTDVTVTFSCSDGETGSINEGSISGIASCGPTQTLTSEGRNLSVTGTATDVAGNSATQTEDGINLDKTAPTVTRNTREDWCSLPGTNGWCRGVQFVGFQASDTLSGLANSAHAAFIQTTHDEGAAVMIESGAVSDVAGNTNPGISAGPFKIDRGAPAFPTPPADQSVNATGSAGAVVSYTATATDAVDTAPVVDCSKKSGEMFPIGATMVSCTATDQAGNTTTVSFTITVKSVAT